MTTVLLLSLPTNFNSFINLYSGLLYTFCCSLPENILSLTLTLNSLTRKCIHFIQSTFTSVDKRAFVSKGILWRQHTIINRILLYILDNKIQLHKIFLLCLVFCALRWVYNGFRFIHFFSSVLFEPLVYIPVCFCRSDNFLFGCNCSVLSKWQTNGLYFHVFFGYPSCYYCIYLLVFFAVV